ncbi:putative 11-S seed storage protein, plant [Helianthus debilis subsp. tardiflorus]
MRSATGLVPLGLCLLLLFHGSLAQIPFQRQPQSPRLSGRSDCQFQQITAREPNRRQVSEAGVSEFWDSFEGDELECAGVQVVRHIINPKGLLLPYYPNTPELVYVVRGQGLQGTVLPGCVETFETSEGGREQFFDKHQKVYRYREGDILALPAGAVHWTYNEGDTPLVVVALRDTSNVANQLDRNFKKFFLAGNPQSQEQQGEPWGQSQRPRGRHGQSQRPGWETGRHGQSQRPGWETRPRQSQRPGWETGRPGQTQRPSWETGRTGQSQRPGWETGRPEQQRQRQGQTQHPSWETRRSGQTQRPSWETGRPGQSQRPTGRQQQQPWWETSRHGQSQRPSWEREEQEWEQYHPGQQRAGGRHQGGKYQQEQEGYNMLAGFDDEILQQVYDIEYDIVMQLKGLNDDRGLIVLAEDFQVLIPEEQEQYFSPRGNGIEQTICSTQLRANIASPAIADVYNPRGGRISALNSHKLPVLESFQLSAERGVLYKNAVLAPHYNLNAHSIMYIISGSSRLQIVRNDGSQVFDDWVQEGQLIVVPQDFAVIKKAGEEGCEWVAFKTNDNAMTTQLAGHFSYIRALPEEVLMNSYSISREDAKILKYSRKEGVVLSPRSGSISPIRKAENVVLKALFG